MIFNKYFWKNYNSKKKKTFSNNDKCVSFTYFYFTRMLLEVFMSAYNLLQIGLFAVGEGVVVYYQV